MVISRPVPRKSENQIKEQINTLSVLFDLSQQFLMNRIQVRDFIFAGWAV
jgi:hypothetical protein